MTCHYTNYDMKNKNYKMYDELNTNAMDSIHTPNLLHAAACNSGKRE